MRPPRMKVTVSRMMVAVSLACVALALVAEDRKLMRRIGEMKAARAVLGAARIELERHEEGVRAWKGHLGDARARLGRMRAGVDDAGTGHLVAYRRQPDGDPGRQWVGEVEALRLQVVGYERRIREEEGSIAVARVRVAEASVAFKRARAMVIWPFRID